MLDTAKRLRDDAKYLRDYTEYKRTADSIERAADEVEHLRSDFAALQTALVGKTGLSAIQEAHKLRAMHPLTKSE